MSDNGASNRIVSSFAVVVLVAFVVLCVATWQIITTRHLASENSALIRKVADQAATQQDACKNFETLKDAVNDFHTTIHALLETGIKTNLKRAANIRDPKLKAADRAQVRQLRKLLRHIRIVKASCASSPAVRS